MSVSDLLNTYFKKYAFDHPTLEHAFRADPARTMERLYTASYGHPGWFTPKIVDFIVERFEAGPKEAFWVFHNVAAGDPERARAMMDLFARHFPRAPGAAQDALFYVAANDPQLLRPDVVDLVCAHIPADACRAFLTLQHLLAKRPELVRKETVEAVVRHLGAQVNQAFYFIREVVKARPEFVPTCTLALFECVLAEPHFYTKREMMQDVLAIAHHSHVKTDLERALREPPTAGTRRARVLMALLFRQKTRALQRVLLEALDHAAKWPAVWDFLVFLIDQSDPKAVSTAAAEEFLESAFRLGYLVTPQEFETLLVDRLDFTDAPAAKFPAKAKFLEAEEALADLYRRVSTLAERFGVKLRMTPLRAFAERTSRLERERRSLESAQTTRRLRRRRSLEEQISRRDPTPAERRKLAKEVADALRAEAVEITRAAIRAATLDAYKAAARHVLGRDADLSKIDPGVLPAFLYYERLGRKPNNRKYLARLIEDRIEGRPHDWMRTEPPAAEWAERVKAAQPGVRLDRWRAEFSREFGYNAEGAAREKERRVGRDLAQTRELFRRLRPEEKELEGIDREGYDGLRERFLKARAKAPDSPLVEEIGQNLERVRIAMQMPDSDYEGRIRLDVETDPFQYLFMGEYGFASCLSIRGSNVWSAVSNAIDVDKVVVWARDGAGNIVGRRLIALTPQGLVSYRTYTNRHGLALDGFFEDFLAAYAAHCGTKVTHHVSPGPLLSDDWYDDGAI